MILHKIAFFFNSEWKNKQFKFSKESCEACYEPQNSEQLGLPFRKMPVILSARLAPLATNTFDWLTADSEREARLSLKACGGLSISRCPMKSQPNILIILYQSSNDSCATFY